MIRKLFHTIKALFSLSVLQKRCIRIAVLVFILFPYNTLYAQENIRFDRITNRNGLSHNTIYGIIQDSRGFMWFGTQDGGLNKFDGYRFTVYKHIPTDHQSISINNVNFLCEDQEGMIWVATWGGGLNRFNPYNETFTHYKHNPDNPKSLASDVIQSMLVDKNYTLWIGTVGGGLNKLPKSEWNADNPEFVRYTHSPKDSTTISHNRIWAIDSDTAGCLWIGTSNGLNRFHPESEKFVRFMHQPDKPDGISHDQIRTVYVDRQNTIWVGTARGIDRYNPQNRTFTHFEPYPNSQEVQKNKVNAIFEDSYHGFWIGTQMGGISKFNRHTHQFYHYTNDPTNPNSISYNDIRVICEDSYGMLWLATRGGGVNKFELKPAQFKHFKSEPDNLNTISGNRVTAFCSDKQDNLWIGTDRNGLNKLDKQSGKFILFKGSEVDENALNNSRIKSLLVDNDGIIWIGTDEGGLNRYDPIKNEFTHYTHNKNNPASISDNEVYSLLEDKSGRLWVGTKEGLDLFDKDKQVFIHYSHNPDDINSVSNNRIFSIYEDAQGFLWIGTDNGLNRLHKQTKTFKRYLHDSHNPGSISNNDIFSIHQDKNGILWFGTGMGLAKLTPENREKGYFVSYLEGNGLRNATIYGILEDNHNNLWLSTVNGLSKFNKQKETFRTYDVFNGLQSNEFLPGAYFKKKSGELLFGGINGFNLFHPDSIKDNLYKPDIMITDFRIFNQPVKIGEDSPLKQHINFAKKIVLTYHDEVFSFEFAALHFVAPDKNQYAYMMKGFDKDWNFFGNKRFVMYNSLPAGKYVFKVRGANSDGVWNNKGTEIEIEILPPFWQTLWFRILFGLVVFGSVYAWYKSRINRIERQKKELEKQVKERTAEVVKQKNEIEQKNAKLEIQKAEILVQSDKLKTANEEIMATNEALEQQKEELQVTLQHLKETQAQLIQSEKMAALGQLIAGVAHEINTPIGAIKSSVNTISSTLNDSINQLPKLLKILPEKYHTLFFQLVDRSLQDVEEHTSREERKLKRKLRKQLEEYDIDDADSIADTLADMHIYSDIEPFLALFKDENEELVLQTAYSLSMQQKNSENIRHAIDRVSKIVYALKTYAHFDHTDTKVKASVTDTVETVLTIYHNQLKQGIEVIKHYDEIPDTYCYPDDLNQVWTNLIHNAIQAMKNTGQLTIAIKNMNEQISVSITDSGEGIPQEIQKKIFQPFFTTKPAGEGSGLGLDIVRRIVKKHDGAISLESEVGKGTTFTITLPVKADENDIL